MYKYLVDFILCFMDNTWHMSTQEMSFTMSLDLANLDHRMLIAACDFSSLIDRVPVHTSVFNIRVIEQPVENSTDAKVKRLEEIIVKLLNELNPKVDTYHYTLIVDALRAMGLSNTEISGYLNGNIIL